MSEITVGCEVVRVNSGKGTDGSKGTVKQVHTAPAGNVGWVQVYWHSPAHSGTKPKHTKVAPKFLKAVTADTVQALPTPAEAAAATASIDHSAEFLGPQTGKYVQTDSKADCVTCGGHSGQHLNHCPVLKEMTAPAVETPNEKEEKTVTATATKPQKKTKPAKAEKASKAEKPAKVTKPVKAEKVKADKAAKPAKASKPAADGFKPHGVERAKDVAWTEKKVAVFKALKALKAVNADAAVTATQLITKDANLTGRDVRHYCYHAKAAGLTGIVKLEGQAGYGFYLTKSGLAVDPAKELKARHQKAAK
jgi:hypothetical protein